MQNPEFMSAAESLGKGLMQQVGDPETLGMMELFSNPANQEVLKAKMEELKGDPELKEVMEDIEKNGQGAMMKYMQVRCAASGIVLVKRRTNRCIQICTATAARLQGCASSSHDSDGCMLVSAACLASWHVARSRFLPRSRLASSEP